jgi:hypothetical protein
MTSKNLSSLLSILIRLSLVFSAMTVVSPSQITAQIQPRTLTPDKSGGNTGPSDTTYTDLYTGPVFNMNKPTDCSYWNAVEVDGHCEVTVSFSEVNNLSCEEVPSDIKNATTIKCTFDKPEPK